MTPDYHPDELKWWEVILLTLIDVTYAASILSVPLIFAVIYLS